MNKKQDIFEQIQEDIEKQMQIEFDYSHIPTEAYGCIDLDNEE